MFKVVVVDDDLMIRTQIKTGYSLENDGYYVVGEAPNGKIGLEVVKKLLPDIVITDMSMPNMDGITFIEHLYREFPDIKVIVISGYDDFEYVSKSLKMKVVDYVLKHTLTRKKLLEVLNKSAELIDGQRKMKLENQKTVEQAILGQQMLRRTFLLNLLDGKAGSIEDIKQKATELSLNITTTDMKFIVVELDNMNIIEQRYNTVEISGLMRTICSILQKAIEQIIQGYIEHIYQGRFVVFLSYRDVPSRLFVMDSVSRIIEIIRGSLKRYMNFTATYIVGEMYESIDELPLRYEQALEEAKQKFYLGNDSIITQGIIKRKKEVFMTLSIEHENQIADAIGSRDLEKCLKIIEKIYEDIIQKFVSQTSCQIITVELINLLKRYAKGISEEFFQFDKDGNIKTGVLSGGTLLDMRLLVEKVYTEAFQILQQNEETLNYRDYTIKTIEYIRKNYMNNIGLSNAADQIGINKSYLSRVFAEDCGMGFTEYLNRFRVQKAKYFIRAGGEKIKSISEKVGFNNNTYFFKVFKEVTGMTPQEYENSQEKLENPD